MDRARPHVVAPLPAVVEPGLGDARQGQALDADVAAGRPGHRQLALAAVDQQQVGQVALGQTTAQPPGQGPGVEPLEIAQEAVPLVYDEPVTVEWTAGQNYPLKNP